MTSIKALSELDYLFRRMNKHPHVKMTIQEERELLIKAKEGCLDSRDKLILNNWLYWVKIINKYSTLDLNASDLFQLCYIGCVKAIDKYDLQFGVKFASYAQNHINRELSEYFNLVGFALRLPMNVKVDKTLMNYIDTEDTIGTKENNYEKKEALENLNKALTKLTDFERFVIETHFGLNNRMEVPNIENIVYQGKRINRALFKKVMNKLKCILEGKKVESIRTHFEKKQRKRNVS